MDSRSRSPAKPKRRRFAVTLAILVLGAGILSRFVPSTPAVRNILLITLDTCRADRLGCLGFPGPITPNLDTLASESILFENAVTPYPMTLPAHASIMTGTYPPDHGVRNNLDYRLGERHETLAEILQREGFATGAIVSSIVLDRRYGLNRGFESYDDRFRDKDFSDLERRGDETSDLAIAWIDKHRAGPFFLFVHYMDPHAPYDPPRAFADRFPGDPYSGEIAAMDHGIGRVLDRLRQWGLDTSTLIVIAGDHGESLGAHGEQEHGFFVYQDTLRVPLIAHLPGGEKSMRIADPVSLVDIMPTILSAARLDIPQAAEGVDLASYWKSRGKPPEKRFLYFETLAPTQYGCNPLRGVIADSWKYIQTTRPELYDLRPDPEEQRNLIDGETERARTMRDELEQIPASSPGAPREDAQSNLDEASLKRLKALGYLGGGAPAEDLDFDEQRADAKDFIEYHARKKRAGLLILSEKYDEAEKILAAMEADHPRVAYPHEARARIAFKQGKWDEAIAESNAGLDLNPNRSMAAMLRKQLGRAYRAKGELDEAVKHWTEALEIKPHDADVIDSLAQAAMEQNKPNIAAAYFKRLIEIQPDDHMAHGNLGAALFRQGEIEEALEQWAEVLRLEPDDPGAHNNMAIALYKQEMFEQAAAHWRALLDRRPDQPQVRNNLGKAYLKLGRRDEAIEQWIETLRIDPNALETLNNLAWLYATRAQSGARQWREALEYATRACKLTRYQNPGFLDTLAVAQAAEGRFDEAAATARQAARLAVERHQEERAKKIRRRIELYEAGQPYREPEDKKS